MSYYSERILTNLRGEEDVDWDEAKKAYAVKGFKPEKLKFVQRHDFLKKLCGAGADGVEVHKRARDDAALANGTKSEVFLRLIARQYCALESKGARLPKFSKWVTSLFKDDKDLHNALAKYAQVGNGDNDIIISCNPVDILRAADTKHYWSCLNDTGGFNEVLPGVITKCPGIAVAYINGADEKMKSRVWLHVIEVDGEMCIGIASNVYGHGLNVPLVAKKLKDMGVKPYQCTNYGEATGGKYVGAFTQAIHWDTYTWSPNPKFLAI